MATVKPTDPLPRRRRLRRIALVAALVLLGVLVWYWQPLSEQASAGTAYGARVGCSCRFVSGRSLENCRDDFLSGMQPVMLSEDDQAKSVTARIPLVASATASFRPGEGCVLEPWTE